MEDMKYMKDFDFITDEFLMEELEELKKEDSEFYEALVKYLRRNRYKGADHLNYLTNLINYQLFGE